MTSSEQTSEKITILGAGSWGTTLAWLFSSAGKTVELWSHNPAKAQALNDNRNLTSPAEFTLPATVKITSDMRDAVESASVIVFCCSSQVMRQVGKQASEHLREVSGSPPILVSGAKGLELSTFKRMTEVLKEISPQASVCTLSGPNLAVEILQGLPTATVVSSPDESAALYVQKLLTSPTFRIYKSTDTVGVEMGGTLKNIIAIAAGCSDGLSLGANSKAALLTRGLAEMTRLAVALGANPLTMAGLAGMGDLLATCASPLSRNYRLGWLVAHGKSLAEALSDLKGIAEGVTTTEAVCELSQKLRLQLPIAEQVDATLKGKNTPRGAIMALMSRPLASE